ncbi:cell wall protein RBR3-like isoform X1, partial [Clarias magur]
FHLIFIALVLWGDANGFSVWNKAFIGDWKTGHFNASWNQNVHLPTPVQAFELLSRKVAHGNVGKGGGKSNSSVLESVVKTAQQDSNFVQPSGDHDKLVLNKDWPVKGHDEPGFQIPSFFQSADTSSQASGSWTSLSQSNMAQVPVKYLPSAFLTHQTTPYSTQTATTITKSQTDSSYQPSTSTPVLIGQSAVHQVPSLGGFTLYPGWTSGWYTILGGQMMPPYSQVSGFPSQLLNQPSTTKQAMAGQPHSAPPAPFLPASTLNQGKAPSRYNISQGHSIPSSSQSVITKNEITASQIQSASQLSTTWVMADQFHSTSPAPTLVASNLNQVLASSSNLTVKDQIIQFSSQSVITTNQINVSQSPSHSSNMAVLTGQSDIVQVQPLGGLALYPGQTSGWYTIFEGRHIPSSSQVSGFQSQSLYQPSTTKPVMAGQFHSTSPALSLAVSLLKQGEAPSKNILQDPSTLSSESVGTTSSQTQSSYKPSTPVLPGQSGIALAQSLREGAFYPGHNSGWYTILQGWKIPSSFRVPGFQSQSLYQPSTAPQALEGQSHSISPAPSLDASTSDQGLSSSSNQSLQDQIIASSSQFVDTKNQSTESQTQSSYQSSTTTPVLAVQSVIAPVLTGQSGIAPALSSSPLLSLEASASYPGQTSGWYNILQGQKIPSSSQVCGFQTQSAHQPSTTTQVSTSQSASTAPGQASGTSTLYQGLAYSSNLTLQDQSIPSSSQTVFTENQISESQTQSSNQPSTTTQVVAGQSASRLPSMGASTLYQGQASS